MDGLATDAAVPKTEMIDATYLKAHSINTKLLAVIDAEGRPLRFFMTVGQLNDYAAAVALLGCLPKADWLLADRGYDADWFLEALKDKSIKPCIPGRKSRGTPSGTTNVATASRKCLAGSWTGAASRPAKTFLSAIALAATVLFWH